MEDNFEKYDTIEESPCLLLGTSQSSNIKIKDLIINNNISINEYLKINNISNADNMTKNNLINTNKGKEYQDIILMQRENRKIMSEIKKIISRKDINDMNMKILLIKNVLNDYNRNISLLYDDKNNTLLHLYVMKNDINSLEIILTIYINILKYSEDLYKFLFTKNIENKTIFDIAIEKNYISIIKILFSQVENDKNYTDKKNYMNYFKNNIFHKCAEYNNCYLIIFFYEKLKKYYKYFTIEKISNRNYKDQMNPLHIACQKGYKEVLNLLLDLGGDINSRDINGYTLLHYTVMSRNESLTKILILRGANKFIKDWNNRTPYNLALSMSDKNLVDLLYHKNFCKRKCCGDEIGPLVKTNNHCFLLILILFTIILKTLLIVIFICLYNNIHFDIFFLKEKKSIEKIYRNEFNCEDNYQKNKTKLYDEINLSNYFNCIDCNCYVEVIILFFSLFTDIFLLFIIIIFKCSKSIYIPKKSEKEVESLINLYENNDNICVKCRIPINKDTKHCLICNRCVNNWDHHCYWLNSCINDKNYVKFKLFLLSTLLFLLSELIYYINSLYLLFNTKKLFIEQILNMESETFLFYIIKILFFIINIFLLILIIYSLIFIIIPMIKNSFFISMDDNEIEINEIKQDLFMNIIDNNDVINLEYKNIKD